jgi:predicted ATP-dependent endonuclease of OLD family
MKLRYLKAKNVFSFGEEEVNVTFDQLNVIAGPNDSGKTNILRILSQFESMFKTFDYSYEQIQFKGDNTKPFHIEVGIELNPTEVEALVITTLAQELKSIVSKPDADSILGEETLWILEKYYTAILRKSFEHLAIVISKDALRNSEPKMFALLVDGIDTLFINRSGYILSNLEYFSGYQNVDLWKTVINDFHKRFEGEIVADTKYLIESNRHEKMPSSLVEILKKSLSDHQTNKVVELGGFNIDELRSRLGPKYSTIVNKLYSLSDKLGLTINHYSFWYIIEEVYKKSFVRLKESRYFNSMTLYSKQENEMPVIGTEQAMLLFKLSSSQISENRKKFNLIKKQFKELTEADFELSLREKEIDFAQKETFGVIIPAKSSMDIYTSTQFSPLSINKEPIKRKVYEAFIQVIKGNHAISIEQSASGLQEVLYLLITIIGEDGKILLLDEPELHLHPTMQKKIQNLLVESKEKRNNQIILITHSPYLTPLDELTNTWRFFMTEGGTSTHNVVNIFSQLKEADQKNLLLKFRKPEVRSVLFSKGVILVEGISDKLTVEQVDRYLSSKKIGANLDENEWPILDIDGKKNLRSYMALCKMLGVKAIAILDIDALMHIEHEVEINGKKVKTSTVFSTLLREEGEYISDIEVLVEKDSDWYSTDKLELMRNFALKRGIFVFTKDLEGVLESKNTDKRKKPLKAIEKIIELIEEDRVPLEFRELGIFLQKVTSKSN